MLVVTNVEFYQQVCFQFKIAQFQEVLYTDIVVLGMIHVCIVCKVIYSNVSFVVGWLGSVLLPSHRSHHHHYLPTAYIPGTGLLSRLLVVLEK